MIEKSFTLPDGRKLGYAIYGSADGQPLLYFHGTPSSRCEPLLLESFGVDVNLLLRESRVKLIAVDRPGMGHSSLNPRGTFLSFADDVKQLAGFFHIGRCPVLCWSGGGPYALAIAHRYPQLISTVFILCGFSRCFDREVLGQMGLSKWYFKLAKSVPWLLKGALKMIRNRPRLRRFVPQKVSGVSYEDYVLLKDPEGLNGVVANTLKEACRNGAEGPMHEARIYYNDFGFALRDIQQPVHYWWGTRDMAVIRLHAEAVEKHVPNSVMHYHEREGHLSMYIKGFVEVVEGIGRT